MQCNRRNFIDKSCIQRKDLSSGICVILIGHNIYIYIIHPFNLFLVLTCFVLFP